MNNPIPEVLGPPTDDDLAGLGDVEEPGGEIGGVAHRGVVHAQVASDRAHHHGTGVDPDAHAEVEPVYALDVGGERLEPFLDRQRRAERPRGVVLVGDRRAEERHDAVTEELVDRPLAAVDGREDHLEDAVHDAVDVLGVEALRHCGEAGHVGEHHGDGLALTLEGALRGEDLLGEVFRRVGDGGGFPERGACGRRRRDDRGGRGGLLHGLRRRGHGLRRRGVGAGAVAGSRRCRTRRRTSGSARSDAHSRDRSGAGARRTHRRTCFAPGSPPDTPDTPLSGFPRRGGHSLHHVYHALYIARGPRCPPNPIPLRGAPARARQLPESTSHRPVEDELCFRWPSRQRPMKNSPRCREGSHLAST